MSLQNGVLGAFGLYFEGLGPPFWRVRASFSKALDVIFGTTNAKNAQKPAKTKAPSQGGQTAKGWVGGGDPPRGVSIRRPPKVEPRAKRQTNSPKPSLKCRPSSHPPLFYSLPRSSGTTGIQLQIFAFCGFWRFFCEFLPLGNVLQKLHRKNIEKSAKIKDFGLPKPSQNLAKMPSKSRFQKTSIFSPSGTRFKNDFKKTSKKMRKSRI